MKCRNCKSEFLGEFLDLGSMPPANSYLNSDEVDGFELELPLKIVVCKKCLLVQTDDSSTPDLFFNEDYAYFSSTSSIWVEHARLFCESMIAQLDLSKDSFVVEIASNDGYLLKNFVDKSIPTLGIEPTLSTASVAREKGIEVLTEFFTKSYAKIICQDYRKANLIVANNVLAHVPDVNDFVSGLKELLDEAGVITVEFPHLLNLLEQVQFDTIYHEHYSYFSFFVVESIFEKNGLKVFMVDELDTHGGSLRVYCCHSELELEIDESVNKIHDKERLSGINSLGFYQGFQEKVDACRDDLIKFLEFVKGEGKKIVGYGAAAKGNTLLNYCGVDSRLLPVVFDKAESKKGKFLPGSKIPVRGVEELYASSPDYILILPWNISSEIKKQISSKLKNKIEFLVAIPSLRFV